MITLLLKTNPAAKARDPKLLVNDLLMILDTGILGYNVALFNNKKINFFIPKGFSIITSFGFFKYQRAQSVETMN